VDVKKDKVAPSDEPLFLKEIAMGMMLHL
jgi:hypothetical protein